MAAAGPKLAVSGLCVRHGSESEDSRTLEEHFVCIMSQEGGIRMGEQTHQERFLGNTLQEDGKLAYRCEGLTCVTKNQGCRCAWTWYQSSSVQKMQVGTSRISLCAKWRCQFRKILEIGASATSQKRRASESPVCGLLDRTRRRKEASVVSGGIMDWKAWRKMSRILLRCEEDGTVEVRRWITEVTYDALTGMAKAHQEKALGRVWSQVLEDDEERNVLMNSNMWSSKGIFRHVVGKPKEEEQSRSLTCLRALHRFFPVEDFSSNHRERQKKTHEWLVVRSLRVTV